MRRNEFGAILDMVLTQLQTPQWLFMRRHKMSLNMSLARRSDQYWSKKTSFDIFSMGYN